MVSIVINSLKLHVNRHDICIFKTRPPLAIDICKQTQGTGVFKIYIISI